MGYSGQELGVVLLKMLWQTQNKNENRPWSRKPKSLEPMSLVLGVGVGVGGDVAQIDISKWRWDEMPSNVRLGLSLLEN